MRKGFICVLVLLLMIAVVSPHESFALTSKQGKKASKPGKKQVRSLGGIQSLGDAYARVYLGVRLLSASNLSGEFLSSIVGEADVVETLFGVEYGFYYSDDFVWLISLPMTLELNPNAQQVLYSLDLGLGARFYLWRYLFVEGQFLVSWVSRNHFQFGFNGVLLSIGGSIRFLSRWRFFMVAQVPLHVWPGRFVGKSGWFVKMGFNGLVGVDILF